MVFLLSLAAALVGANIFTKGAVGESLGGFNMMYTIVQAITQWDASSPLITVGQALYNILCPFALSLALGFSILEILEAVSRQGGHNTTIEMIVMPLVKFAAVYLILYNGAWLVGKIFAGSNAFVNYIDTGVVANIGNNLQQVEEVAGVSMSGVLASTFAQLIPGMIALVTQAIACVILAMNMVGVKIEIILRFAFMPFAIANVAQGGVHSSGIGYMKRFLANIFLLGCMALTVKLAFIATNEVCIDVSAKLASMISREGTGGAFKVIYSIGNTLFVSTVGPFAAITAVQSVKSALENALG